ncbi:GntR family transcriptional regulator [Rossellomorea marisflavi]|uniref:GntR family transcriptional regulator n=1 Tax=Rossellomorea marisflavi TaxID=189381 RepID=UPI0006A995A8|nr:GntR family transcriptional regulator [Rossellomorea marisflavi]MCM2589879.1 GntR family transcriptional regulator [Rossellomorea marisflavi]
MNRVNHGKESLPEKVYHHLLQQILNGAIKAGEKIIEEDIARDLGTSRAPVREALYLLKVDGIAERIPRIGTIVKDFSDKEIIEYNDAVIGLLQSAIEQSQPKWNDSNLRRLQSFAGETDEACRQDDVQLYQSKVEQLITHVFTVSDNKALMRFYKEANHILMVFAQVKWTRETMKNFNRELKVFTSSLLRGNFEEAKNAVKVTLDQGVI